MAARQVYAFTATIPAGTTAAAPVTVDTSFSDAVVAQIDLTVPPGPSGLMGFQLWVKGGQVLPSNQGAWFIWNDRYQPFILDNLPDSGAWQIVGYNSDIYDHTVYAEFQVEPAAVTAATAQAGAADATAASVLQIAAG